MDSEIAKVAARLPEVRRLQQQLQSAEESGKGSYVAYLDAQPRIARAESALLRELLAMCDEIEQYAAERAAANV